MDKVIILPDTLLITLGLTENDYVTDCSILPNPSEDGFFDLHATMIKDSRLSIIIYDIYGRSIFTDSWSANMGNHTFDIDLSTQASGVYIMELSNEHSIVQKLKMVKSK